MNQTQITIGDEEYDVYYSYKYDPGQWTLSNGDPGYPSSLEVEIHEISWNGVVLGVEESVWEAINDKLVDKISPF